MTDSNPPIAEVTISNETNQSPERQLVGSLLGQYAETLGLFSDEVDDEEFTQVLDRIVDDLTLTPAELAAAHISIRSKAIRDEDERRIRAGSDPGIWIQIQSGHKEININGWGGMRAIDAPMDYLDSHSASKVGLAHSDRTADILDEDTVLNVNVLLSGRLHSDTQFHLARNKIELRTLRSRGTYIDASANQSVTISDRRSAEQPQQSGTANYAVGKLQQCLAPLLPLRK